MKEKGERVRGKYRDWEKGGNRQEFNWERKEAKRRQGAYEMKIFWGNLRTFISFLVGVNFFFLLGWG